MKLDELYYTGRFFSDKGLDHNYISGYYVHEFMNRELPIKLMEIGMGYQGGSIDLWLEWFINGTIVLIEYDKNLVDFYTNKWGIRDRVEVIHADAYNTHTLDMFDDDTFDWIIDDGPHTVESQIYSVSNWILKVKQNGKLIIEDVQDETWIDKFNKVNTYPHRIIDLRKDKNRYDDLLYEITKVNK